MKGNIMAIAFATIFFLPAPICRAELGRTLPEEIAYQLEQLSARNVDEGYRAEIAANMSSNVMVLWESKRIEEIDNRTIGKIAALLDDDSDAVRGSAAGALDFFGPRAKTAVPALHRALKRIQAENRRIAEGTDFVIRGPDSEAAIQLALRRISGLPDNLDR